MDHGLKGMTVDQFRAALLNAAERVQVVQPEALREPIALWLRAVEAEASYHGWRHLLGRPVVSAWNAAQAILAEDLKQPGGTP